jgi:hypothetical protein
VTIAEVCDEFMQTDPHAWRWAEYPDGEGDEWSDTVACVTMSRRFAKLCLRRGLAAEIVEGDVDGEHVWVRVGTVNVDWTARQFHSLDPDDPALQDLPCPFIWEGEGHPLDPA